MAQVLVETNTLKIEHETYRANLMKTATGYSIKPHGGTQGRNNSFSGLAQEKTGKVYLIRTPDDAIVYIGKTSQKLSQRFYRGLNTESDRWYDGYSWKENSQVGIHCLVVRDIRHECASLTMAKKLKHLDRLAEALEAELVFHFRSRYGKWPSDQTEIHFSNLLEVQEVAETVFTKIESINLFPNP